MMIVAVIMIVIFAAYIFRGYWWRLIETKWYGTETDAFVSRIENTVRYSNGAEFYRHFYYVSFQMQNGMQNEARLINPKGPLAQGSRIRIKYLAEKADCVVLTEIIKA